MGLRLPPTGEGTPHPIGYPRSWWLVLLIPTLGGLASGLLVFTMAPEAEGHGTDALIRAFHRGAGQIRARVPLIKGVASVITIGTGGSAGQEGPIAQIGAGFGSFLARLLRLAPSERRLLMLSGAAGGIGAIFRAPLGGALFAGEVLYATSATEAEALLPCLASSIVAYSTFALFITPRPIFIVPDLAFHGLRELPVFAVLALACTAVGWLYVRVFYGLRDYVFKPLPIPRHVKPALGGLMLGLLALAFPQLMTGGYGWVQWGAIGLPRDLTMPGEPVFVPQMGVGLLLALALLKIVATGLTISSGGSGGVFGPSVFIGGVLGGAVGQFLRASPPDGELLDPAAFALVGMGGFFAGVSKTPLASIVMVCEMTGHYKLLVPLMLVCGLHLALSRHWTLYEEQVPSPIDSGRASRTASCSTRRHSPLSAWVDFSRGCPRRPLASIVMVCEMTGHYKLLVPLMLVCGLHWPSRGAGRSTRSRSPSPSTAPRTRGTSSWTCSNGSGSARSASGPRAWIWSGGRPRSTEILRRVAESAETLFPVVDGEGRSPGSSPSATSGSPCSVRTSARSSWPPTWPPARS